MNEHLQAENEYEHKLSSHPIFRTIGDAEIDKYLALRDRKLAKTTEPIFALFLAANSLVRGAASFPPRQSRELGWRALAWQAVCIAPPAN